MRNSATIKPTLYIQKTLKNGKHPIVIQIIKDRKVKRISLGYSLKVDEWDFGKNRPTKKYAYQTELETVIAEKIKKLQKQVFDLDITDKVYTPNLIVQKANTKRKAVSVVKYFDEIITSLKGANRIGNAEHYQTCKNVLLAFNKGRDLSFSDIDFTLLTKLENYCQARDWKETSISAYMRTLRAAYNRAINENIVSPEIYPFKQYKVGKFNTTTQKRAISEEHIHAIEKLKLDKGSRLFLSQKIFLFSFYTMGTNLVDIANLTWDNVKDGRLKYMRTKTHKPYNIALFEEAQEIVNYYKRKKMDKYIFPIYSEDTHITATQKNNRLHKVMQQTNKDLKDIAEMCGIEENLTTYVARHSAATILKRRNIPTAVISELLGHETEEITQTYLDSFENVVLDSALSILNNLKQPATV